MIRASSRLGLSLLIVALTGGCASGGTESATGQENFGVRMAKMNLWREAMFRFQRAAQMDPDNAMIRNNLAVAYEANGDFENAAKEYREALRLDRANQYIQKNYSRFVEFQSRNRKRQQKQEPKTAAADPASAPSTLPAAPAPDPASASPPPATPPVTPPAVPPANPPANPPSGGVR